MTIQADVFDVPIEMRKLNCTNEFVSCSEEVENIIQTFHKFDVCEGYATPNSISNVETSFAFRDSSGNLRHQKCTMIIDVDILYQKKYFLPCKNAKATLAAKTVRLQKQKDIKRLVFTSNHADKVKLRLMRDELRQVQRRVNYNERSKTVLRKQMIDARKKMSFLNTISLQEKLDQQNICQNEKIVIKEILEASRHKNWKGHRY